MSTSPLTSPRAADRAPSPDSRHGADALRESLAITSPDEDPRCPVLTRSAALEAPAGQIVDAELVATAHGVYEVRLGGQRLGRSVLDPGWSSYEHRLQVQSLDVTELVREHAADGVLALSVTLAGGWWRGQLGFDEGVDYGPDLAFLAALRLRYADGREQVLRTDEQWQAHHGPIELASLYHGQREDRRLPDTPRRAVRLASIDRETLVDQSSPLILEHEQLRPVRTWTSPSGATLLDFGQNLVGRLRLSVTGPAGTAITLRHAEVLEDGELALRPLRRAEATDRLVLAGTGAPETFDPTFTVHGFRYAEITGWPAGEPLEGVTAVVVHSALTRTGWFESSHPGVNRLIENSVWSQRGNFLAVPTDCPQRDERMGWTGDIAAFAATAAFQFQVAGFLGSWLRDVRVEAEANPRGIVPFVVPDLLKYGDEALGSAEGWGTPTAVWGDAALWVPEALWWAYGDREALAEQYPAMVSHLESVERALSPSGLWDQGFQFADWLDPDAPPQDPGAAKADKGVVATASLIRSARFAAQAAGVLGHEQDERRWQDLAERTLTAFTSAYVHEDGTLTSDCATVYALAIAFDLLEEEAREHAGRRLVELVREADHRVSTGFAGTPFITWALTGTGHVEDAYRLLLEEGCPSWLYPVTQGATTIWERWDSLLPDGSVNPGDMTSFNHYALGAVADWIYQVVLGIRPAAPGYRRVLVQPVPGPGIDWVRGALDSPVGRIEVSWEATEQGLRGSVSIPEGAEAEIVLPDGTRRTVGPGTHAL